MCGRCGLEPWEIGQDVAAKPLGAMRGVKVLVCGVA